MTVAKNILSFRKAKNITQRELAEKLGKTQQTVSALENGSASPTIRILAQIADILDVSLIDLVSEDDSPGYPLQNSEVRNYKQTEWLKMYDWLNDDGIKKAEDYIKQLKEQEKYQSKDYKEFRKLLNGYSIKTGIKLPKE